jgi:hypothetical protein
MIRSTMVAAVLLVVACSGSNTPIQGMSVATGCQIILSGGLEASTDQSCTIEATNSSPDAGVAFAIAASGASYGTLSYSAELPGSMLMTSTYGTSGPSAVVEATTKLSSSMSREWEQSIDASSPDMGTMSLEVSAIGSSTTTKGETTWTGCHGNLAATLTPAVASDAGVDVVARVIF